ncbi:MAG: hypothetical protein IJG65_09765 [Synergistaceae bacterium]|nr:hypothetical protein [Synergistaceae bacterium]
MTKRPGLSLLNVMVFMLFAVMITAQAFFFVKSSADSVADERVVMGYRLLLDELVEEARDALSRNGDRAISHDNTRLFTVNYRWFYDLTKARYKDGAAWRDWEPYNLAEWLGMSFDVSIHDLDYSFDVTFNRAVWINRKYNEDRINEKIFAAMPPEKEEILDSDDTPVLDSGGNPTYRVTDRYYLIRAWVNLPKYEFLDRKLMYQVLVRRSEDDPVTSSHDVRVLSFQEVWY